MQPNGCVTAGAAGGNLPPLRVTTPKPPAPLPRSGGIGTKLPRAVHRKKHFFRPPPALRPRFAQRGGGGEGASRSGSAVPRRRFSGPKGQPFA